jgi:hypothetical protein
MGDITLAFAPLLKQLSAQGSEFKRGVAQRNAATVCLR